jgi:hypothetical protein
MKRRILTGLAAALALCSLIQILGSSRADASQREAPRLGRYNCTRVADGPAVTDLKLLSVDKYESADKAGVYAYDRGARRIEWLTGTISRQWVGFYTPKGNDNAYDTIVIRAKKDADEGVERDLLKCTLAE